MKIAVSGKGGVGKTTLSSNLVHCFAQRGYRVYAVDADPDASLGMAIGLDPDRLAEITPLIMMQEVIYQKNAGGGAFVSLNPQVDDILEDYTLKEGNIRFLRMGEIKQGGTSCYCKENSFLHSVLNALLLDHREAVVLDMSAGIEHLTRGTARGVDLLLVVTEPTRVSLKTTRSVIALAEDLGIAKVKVLGNKVRLKQEYRFLEDNIDPQNFLGAVPFAEKVLARSIEEDNKLFTAEDLLPGMEEIWEKILEEVHD